MALMYIFSCGLFRKMVFKRKTMKKRRVVKRRGGGGKICKNNKITRKKHYSGGLTEEKKILKSLKEELNLLKETKDQKLSEFVKNYRYEPSDIGYQYEEDRIDSEIYNLQEKIKILEETIKLQKGEEESRENN